VRSTSLTKGNPGGCSFESRKNFSAILLNFAPFNNCDPGLACIDANVTMAIGAGGVDGTGRVGMGGVGAVDGTGRVGMGGFGFSGIASIFSTGREGVFALFRDGEGFLGFGTVTPAPPFPSPLFGRHHSSVLLLGG